MKQTLFAILTMFLSQSAFAGTIDCSSADQKLSFWNNFTQGGAHRWPEYTIILNGAVVLKESFLSEENIGKVDFNFSDKIEIVPSTQIGMNIYSSTYVAKLTLTDLETKLVVFEDQVICKKISIPCPLCP